MDQHPPASSRKFVPPPFLTTVSLDHDSAQALFITAECALLILILYFYDKRLLGRLSPDYIDDYLIYTDCRLIFGRNTSIIQPAGASINSGVSDPNCADPHGPQQIA